MDNSQQENIERFDLDTRKQVACELKYWVYSGFFILVFLIGLMVAELNSLAFVAPFSILFVYDFANLVKLVKLCIHLPKPVRTSVYFELTLLVSWMLAKSGVIAYFYIGSYFTLLTSSIYIPLVNRICIGPSYRSVFYRFCSYLRFLIFVVKGLSLFSVGLYLDGVIDVSVKTCLWPMYVTLGILILVNGIEILVILNSFVLFFKGKISLLRFLTSSWMWLATFSVTYSLFTVCDFIRYLLGDTDSSTWLQNAAISCFVLVFFLVVSRVSFEELM